MSETHKINDPFLGKVVEISSRLTDRLRGKYACGPTLPNGEPEFGWRLHETAPIQHEAAAEIERLRLALQAVAAAKMPGEARRIAVEALRTPAAALRARASTEPGVRDNG